MLTFGAVVTLALGLCCLLDSLWEAKCGRSWVAQAVACAVCLALFSGFYAAALVVQ